MGVGCARIKTLMLGVHLNLLLARALRRSCLIQVLNAGHADLGKLVLVLHYCHRLVVRMLAYLRAVAACSCSLDLDIGSELVALDLHLLTLLVLLVLLVPDCT